MDDVGVSLVVVDPLAEKLTGVAHDHSVVAGSWG